MPNRIIKESILASDNINQLTPSAEVLFYRLMVSCDDFGIFYGSSNMIRARCFPLSIDKIKESSIDKWLEELQKSELIFIYQADGKRYLKLTNWEKHQTVRAQKSKYITPDSDNVQMITDVNNCIQLQADVHVFENENVNENGIRILKKKYLDCVKLLDSEHEKLVSEIGEEGTKRVIEILDNYKGSTGKTYKSDYKAICGWVKKRYMEEFESGGVGAQKKRIIK